MHTLREGAFLGWLFGSAFAFYCAFHAPMHYPRGDAGLGRVTSLLMATMPVAITLGITLVAISGRHIRQLPPHLERKATRIALALNALVLVFWSWYSN